MQHMGKKKDGVSSRLVFVPKQLADALNERNMKAAQLAEKIGIERSSVGRWKNGKTIPSLPNGILAAEALDVTARSLCGPPPRFRARNDGAAAAHIAAGLEANGEKERKERKTPSSRPQVSRRVPRQDDASLRSKTRHD